MSKILSLTFHSSQGLPLFFGYLKEGKTANAKLHHDV